MKKGRVSIFLALSACMLLTGSGCGGETEVHVHDFGEWVTMKQATCTEEGVDLRLCTGDSSHTDWKITDALGHEYDEDGRCIRCGEILKETDSSYFGFTLLKEGGYEIAPKIGQTLPAELVLPAEYDGKPVTSIGPSAFYGRKEITSVSVPDSVTSIGTFAFYDCEELTSVTIGRGVTKIEEGAFRWCSSLTELVVRSGNEVYRSEGNCVIETVSGKLIAGCNASVIPDDGSVISIGNDAFYGSGIRFVRIPDEVTVIGESAFDSSALESVTFGNRLKTIGASAFRYCENLTGIALLNDINEIGDYAFYNCSSLASVVLSDGVASIGKKAFYECVALDCFVFKGTTEAWTNIPKGEYWDYKTASSVLTATYTVVCSDGMLDRNGNPIA